MKKKIIKKKAIVSEDNLNSKEDAFCNEYLTDNNGKQAAIRAGYSAKTADVKASQLLALVKVQNKISELREKRNKRVSVTQDDILKEYKRLGFSNITEYLKAGYTLKEIADLNPDTVGAISSVKKIVTVTDGVTRTVTEFKLHDKLKALEAMSKHTGFFEKDNKQQAGNDIDLSKLSKEELIAFKELMIKAKTDKNV